VREPPREEAPRRKSLAGLLAAVSGHCPNCRRGRLFAGIYRLNRTCEVCEVRFERDHGAWLGAMACAYAASVLILGALATLLVLRWGLFPGIEWVLTGAGVVTVALIWRPAKGFWTWVIWTTGFVTRDGEQA